jgi:hypothetical protein
MLQLAKDEFPEAETVLGTRISGATRGKANRPKPLPEQTTYEKTPKTPEFLELERELGKIARQNIEEHGRSPPGSLNLTPTQSPLRPAPPRRDATSDEIMARYEQAPQFPPIEDVLQRRAPTTPMPDMSWWGQRPPTEAEQRWIDQNRGAYLDWIRQSAPQPPPPQRPSSFTPSTPEELRALEERIRLLLSR